MARAYSSLVVLVFVAVHFRFSHGQKKFNRQLLGLLLLVVVVVLLLLILLLLMLLLLITLYVVVV